MVSGNLYSIGALDDSVAQCINHEIYLNGELCWRQGLEMHTNQCIGDSFQCSLVLVPLNQRKGHTENYGIG